MQSKRERILNPPAIILLSQQTMTVKRATLSACMHMHGCVRGDGDNRRGFKNNTCCLSSWRYLAAAPNVKSSTFTKLDPEKSKIVPSSLQMPTCPMKGANHETTGSGVQIRQHGNLAFFGSIPSRGHRLCWILDVELICSTSKVPFKSIGENHPTAYNIYLCALSAMKHQCVKLHPMTYRTCSKKSKQIHYCMPPRCQSPQKNTSWSFREFYNKHKMNAIDDLKKQWKFLKKERKITSKRLSNMESSIESFYKLYSNSFPSARKWSQVNAVTVK